MKPSTLIPVVAYLAFSGTVSAAPVSNESGVVDKRWCLFGIVGTSCTTQSAAASAKSSSTAKSSTVVSTAAKSSAVVSSSSAAKSSAVSSAVKAVSTTSSAKSSAPTSWSSCKDFDWSTWSKGWTWSGYTLQYVQDWYVDNYGYNPPQGMSWNQVSSLVNKFGDQTTIATPKTTSKYTGKACGNPWTKAPTATSKSTSASITSQAVVTPKSSSVSSASKSSVASSASVSARSSSAVAASSAAASSVALPASSAAASSVAASASSAAASSVAASASSAAASSGAGPASSASVAASASSAAASPVAPSASSAAAPAASASSAAAAASSVAGPASSAVASSVGASASSAAVDVTSASTAADASATGISGGLPGTGSGVPGNNNGSASASSTSSAATPSATVLPQVNGYTYGGCAQEIAGRLLADVQTSSSSQTIESCTALCMSHGLGVAGLEYGSECYCGSIDDTAEALVSGECYMPCSGDSTETCGGPNAINWYYNPDIVPATIQLPAGWTTYGVVSEAHGDRALTHQLWSSSSNTIESCAQGCADAGYLVSGTEYSSECYCGNGFSNGGGARLDDSSAFMKCSGDIAQTCGGPSVLSVVSALGQNILQI